MGVPAPPPPAVPDLPPAPSDWSQSAGANGPLPAIFKDEPIPPTAPTPPITIMAAAPALPVIPSFALPEAAAPTPELTIQPKSLSFGKPKSFKIVPTVKSFKVLGAADIEPAAAAANPAVEFTMPVPEPTPAAAIPPPPGVPPPPEPAAPVTPIVPVNLAPAPVPAPLPTPAPEMPNPFASLAPPIPTPASPPPNTLSRSLPVSDISNAADSSTGDMAGSTDATMNFQPPETLARGRGVTAEAPVDGAAAARFAKPAPAPATAAPKSARNNKPFLVGGAVLVVLLVIVGMIFMRQPKDDLKQMANLDDGKAPIGLSADDSASAPPIVKPKVAESAPTPTAPTPGPSAEHQAAISTVKDFPLDGGRGTVGRWLQYSYTASPGAGSEEWNASTTGENNVLVEYRLVPGESGGKGALYLFEVDGNGLVMGKNLEARQMLAGGPPAEPAKTKKAKVPGKKTAKRRPVIEEPKEVPLLPLPDSGELRPPAEDDGSFGSDTIKSGI